MDGRVRRLRGSPIRDETAEVQTAQSQPSVGTPMEVPVPRKVRVASIFSGRCSDRPGAVAARRLALLAAAERARAWVISRKAMRSSKRALSSRRCFFGGEVALGLFGKDAEHVDALACAEDVDLRLLALVGGSAELHDGRHVDGLDELLEAHGGGMVDAGIGGANGGVEAVGCHLVGAAGLVVLFGGGGGRQVVRSTRRLGRGRLWLRLRPGGVAARPRGGRTGLLRSSFRVKGQRRGGVRRRG